MAAKLPSWWVLAVLFVRVSTLSFYAIVAGWMLSATLEPVAQLAGQEQAGTWLSEQSLSRNLLFTAAFIILTVSIILRA